MASSDIFLSTSIVEGFPLVICEALCLEKPIVATKCTGIIEILDNDKYGILVDQNDEAIFIGLSKLLVNNDLMQNYKRMAKVRANMLFDIKKTMDEINYLLD